MAARLPAGRLRGRARERLGDCSETAREVGARAICGERTDPRDALAAEVREREYGLTISKRASRDAIDCLVALAMAVEWAASIEPPKKSVYEQRWLVVA
jgi:hypothetical protein